MALTKPLSKVHREKAHRVNLATERHLAERRSLATGKLEPRREEAHIVGPKRVITVDVIGLESHCQMQAKRFSHGASVSSSLDIKNAESRSFLRVVVALGDSSPALTTDLPF